MTSPSSSPAGSAKADAQTTGKRIATTLLGRIVGFRRCDPAAIAELVEAARVEGFKKGDVLVRRGEPFDRLCLVLEGSIEISISHANGRRALLAYLQPGDVAGMMSLWDGLPHPSDLIARQDGSRVLIIPGVEWRSVRQRHPAVGQALELQMAYRARLLHERMIVDSTMSLDVRLARQLHLLSLLSIRSDSGSDATVLRLSQADLGDLLGVGRPRANAAVQQLRLEGLIDLHYATVTIVDPAGLARKAGLELTHKVLAVGSQDVSHGNRC